MNRSLSASFGRSNLSDSDDDSNAGGMATLSSSFGGGEGRGVKCLEHVPDEQEVMTFDALNQVAMRDLRLGDRIICHENEMLGPMSVPKGTVGTVIKGQGSLEYRKGAVALWDERVGDVLGRAGPGEFAYKGHGLVKRESVHKQPVLCCLSWAKRCDTCQWPAMPPVVGKHIDMTIKGQHTARVKVLTGLHTKKKCISLEMALKPDHYICAGLDGYPRIELRPVGNKRKTHEFDETASWMVKKRDKAGIFVGLESVFRPGWFLSASVLHEGIVMECYRKDNLFREATTMVVLKGDESNWLQGVEHVEAFVVGDDSFAVRWKPDVGKVRIWTQTQSDPTWIELANTDGKNCVTIITGMNVIEPHKFLVAPLERRHFFESALKENLFTLIGARVNKDWALHKGFDTKEGVYQRRTALPSEDAVNPEKLRRPRRKSLT